MSPCTYKEKKLLRATVRNALVTTEVVKSSRVGLAYRNLSKGVRHMVKIRVRVRET